MTRPRRRLAEMLALTLAVAACTTAEPPPGQAPRSLVRSPSASASGSPSASPAATASPGLPGMPPLLDPHDVYAADRPGRLSPATAGARELVYVPHTMSNDVWVIDQRTYKVIARFGAGVEVQHVVPSYDLRTLYAAADGSNTLLPIDPRTGRPGKPIAVYDPYNLYFTPDGRSAIDVAETKHRGAGNDALLFYDPHTWALRHRVELPGCGGVDHLDFTADGRTALVSCEFANRLVAFDVASERVLRTIPLKQVTGGMPQDVKLSPDGRFFYVADMMAGGVYVVDGAATRVLRFVRTGRGTHGLYIDRSSTRMFVTNRGEGTITVMNPGTGRILATWRLPGRASPDMGGLNAAGTVLWLSGRYHGEVYAIDARTGRLIARIRTGRGPHGLCVWPQPGRYSLGHTGILR
jgi:DNA-binding beta-propeller fold protein YncE